MLFAKLAWGNMKKSGRDYAVYFVTLIISIALIYAFNSLPDQQAVLNLNTMGSEILNQVQGLMTGVSVFIAVFLSFLILYVDRFLMRRRKKEFGTYLLLGMTRLEICKLRLLESVFVLLVSLVAGLSLGVLFSYGLLHVSSSVFSASIKGFGFFVSTHSIMITCLIFCGIFLLSLFLSSGSIFKSRLISLFRAQSEVSTRGILPLPAAVVLWIVSVGVIGYSYYLLSKSGINPYNQQFQLATALVTLGTFGFFWGLSGVLFKFVQLIKPLYFCGLNMFTVRQFASRFSSSHLMVSSVCLCLFLAITGISTGTSVVLNITQNIEKAARVDASTVVIRFDEAETPLVRQMSNDTFPNIYEAYKREAESKGVDPNSIIADSAQIDSFTLPEYTSEDLAKSVGVDSNFTNQIYFVSESQINKALELQKGKPIDLKGSEIKFAPASQEAENFAKELIKTGKTWSFEGKSLSFAPEILDMPLSIGGSAGAGFIAIIPDSLVPAKAIPSTSYLNIMFVHNNEETSKEFNELSNDITDPILTALEEQKVYNAAVTSVSKIDLLSAAYGLSGVVAYMAIYIGASLIMSAAAMLAIQQLSSVSDSLPRYRTLSNLGARESQIKTSVFAQVLVYFLFPLGIALAHTGVATNEVVKVLNNFGRVDITGTVALVIASAAALYGLYMLVSYLGSLSLLRRAD